MTYTARDVVSEVERLVGEAAGAGVQIHAEDGMLETLNRVARLVMTKYSWDFLIQWHEVTLDGVTGLITSEEEFVDVVGLENFLNIYKEGSEQPIPRISRSANPFKNHGTDIRGWQELPYTHEFYEGKRLQFYPKTSTATLNIQTRLDPTPFVWDDVVPFDRDILVAGVAWQVLIGDDLNPGLAEGQKAFMDEKFATIVKALALQPTSSGTLPRIPTDYYTRYPWT